MTLPDTLRLRAAAALALTILALLAATAMSCGGSSGTVLPADEAEPAPDFELPNANAGSNKTISLSQYQDDGPVVLVFYRAYW